MPLKDQGTEEASSNDEVSAGAPDTMNPDLADPAHAGAASHLEPSFGERLRASRERHGMSLHDCAHALRLPTRLLEQLESDFYEGIDYSVYLHGYLRKYADHVRLEREHVEAQLQSLQTRQPELVAGPSLPAWKRGLERYSNAFTYVVLTGIIVVPLVWFGLHGVLKRDMARLQPLNATPVGTPSAVAGADSGVAAHTSTPITLPSGAGGSARGEASSAHPQAPLMASIAPFSAMQAPDQPVVDTVDPAQATPAAAGTRVTVSLQEPSWVEITDTAGRHLEYKLLPAGTHRVYHSEQGMSVRIGNAEGAQVDVDGKPISLDRFKHAKVANFDVANDGTVRPDNS